MRWYCTGSLLAAITDAPADLEDDDEEGGKGSKARKKGAARRRYAPRKARDFKAMDNFEVPTVCLTSLCAAPLDAQNLPCLEQVEGVLGWGQHCPLCMEGLELQDRHPHAGNSVPMTDQYTLCLLILSRAAGLQGFCSDVSTNAVLSSGAWHATLCLGF